MAAPALFLHILSLIILAGASIGGTLMHFALVPTLAATPANFATFGNLSKRYAIGAQIGALLMLLSGLFLASTRGWGDFSQPWLHVKLTLFVALLLNGILIARPIGQKIGMAASKNPNDPAIPGLLRRLTIFHFAQLTGLVIIIALAVFGPR